MFRKLDAKPVKVRNSRGLTGVTTYWAFGYLGRTRVRKPLGTSSDIEAGERIQMIKDAMKIGASSELWERLKNILPSRSFLFFSGLVFARRKRCDIATIVLQRMNQKGRVSNGYILVYDKSRKGSTGLHRLVMEEYLGRKLSSNEVPHHKNGIRSDNSIDNLELRLTGHGAGQSIKERVEDLRKLGCTVSVPENIQRIW